MEPAAASSAATPWRTEQGRLALHNRMRLLARGEGDFADFARDVLAGRAKPHDLLYSSVLNESTLEALHETVEEWHGLSDAEKQSAMTAADAETRAEIAELAALDLSPEKPAARRETPEDDDFQGGIMKDSW
jgi:hypothetical protein